LWRATGWFGRGAPGGGRTDAPPRYLTGEGPGSHAFLFAQTIDGKTYERQRDRLREELTLAQFALADTPHLDDVEMGGQTFRPAEG
jgi:hypothetical protein